MIYTLFKYQLGFCCRGLRLSFMYSAFPKHRQTHTQTHKHTHTHTHTHVRGRFVRCMIAKNNTKCSPSTTSNATSMERSWPLGLSESECYNIAWCQIISALCDEIETFGCVLLDGDSTTDVNRWFAEWTPRRIGVEMLRNKIIAVCVLKVARSAIVAFMLAHNGRWWCSPPKSLRNAPADCSMFRLPYTFSCLIIHSPGFGYNICYTKRTWGCFVE